MAYGPKVSDSALTMGVTASETRQGGSQHPQAFLRPLPGSPRAVLFWVIRCVLLPVVSALALVAVCEVIFLVIMLD